MGLVTSTEMFKKAYEGHYAIGAFNVNNMEIIQGITEAATMEKAPVILQLSKGARAYAKHVYLVKLVEAALLDAQESGVDLPIVLHLDHGPDFETCKACIDGGFTSVTVSYTHLDVYKRQECWRTRWSRRRNAAARPSAFWWRPATSRRSARMPS